jgi:hypothetical protein
VKPTKNVDLLSVPLSQHKLILEKVFQDGAPETYNELVAKVSQAYADNGLKRGMNAVKSLVAMLTSKGAIVKEGTVYAYYPDKLTSTP